MFEGITDDDREYVLIVLKSLREKQDGLLKEHWLRPPLKREDLRSGIAQINRILSLEGVE